MSSSQGVTTGDKCTTIGHVACCRSKPLTYQLCCSCPVEPCKHSTVAASKHVPANTLLVPALYGPQQSQLMVAVPQINSSPPAHPAPASKHATQVRPSSASIRLLQSVLSSVRLLLAARQASQSRSIPAGTPHEHVCVGGVQLEALLGSSHCRCSERTVQQRQPDVPADTCGSYKCVVIWLTLHVCGL